MKNLNWKKNEEYNQLEATFAAKLKSISEEEFYLNNANKTPYHVVTGEFDNQTFSALMYSKNYEHGVDIGETYSCRAIFDPERGSDEPLILMSHLTAGERLKISDLGLTEEMIASLNGKSTEKRFVDSAKEYEQQNS